MHRLLRSVWFGLVLAICQPTWSELRAQQPPPVDSSTNSSVAGETADTAEDPRDVDAQVEARLRAIFARVEGLEHLTVEFRDGIARVGGSSTRTAADEVVTELANEVDGVLWVDTRIEQSGDLVERITPSIDRMFAWVRDLIVLLPLIGIAILVFVGFWMVSKWVSLWAAPFDRVTDNPLIRGVLRQIVRTVLIVAGAFFALEIIGATALVGAILGAAGVVGLAVGFAFRSIAENYLASIILGVRQPFRPADLVEIDGRLGTVLRLTTRETVLLTPDGNHLSLPNAKVFESSIVNFTRNPHRRFDVGVGVGTDVDLKRASALGLEVLTQMAGVIAEPAPFARIESLGDSNVTLRFFGWVDQTAADYGKVASEAVRLIKAIMDEHEIDMPVPTYDVRFARRSASASSTRSTQLPTGVRADIQSAAACVEAEQVDVELDGTHEAQVAKERANSDEVDLLER